MFMYAFSLLIAGQFIRLSEVVVVEERDSIARIRDSVESPDLRNVLYLQPSSMFRELGNRFVFSIRGLEDKQNTLMLEGISLNNPVWGYIPSSILIPDLLSDIAIYPDDYSANVGLSRGAGFSMQAGMYGRGGFSFHGNNYGVAYVYDENRYPYCDPFGRCYTRENNFAKTFNGFIRGNRGFLFAFDSRLGMPMRGYGAEGNDREEYSGAVFRWGRLEGMTQMYRYNDEKPLISGRIDYGIGSFNLDWEGWDGHHRVGAHFHIHRKNLDIIAGFLYGNSGNLYPRYRFSLVAGKNFYVSVNLKDRIPSFSELYFDGAMAKGNPDLSPEYFNTLQAGWNGGLGPFWVRGDVFSSIIVHPIFWKPGYQYWRPENGKYLLLYGLELLMRSDYMGFTFSLVKNRLDGNSVLPYRPEVVSSVFFVMPFGEFNWRVEGMYYGERPVYFSPESGKLPPILMLNMAMEMPFWRGRLQFYLNNLLNRNWEFISGYPTEPFSVVVRFVYNMEEGK